MDVARTRSRAVSHAAVCRQTEEQRVSYKLPAEKTVHERQLWQYCQSAL